MSHKLSKCNYATWLPEREDGLLLHLEFAVLLLNGGNFKSITTVVVALEHLKSSIENWT